MKDLKGKPLKKCKKKQIPLKSNTYLCGELETYDRILKDLKEVKEHWLNIYGNKTQITILDSAYLKGIKDVILEEVEVER
jgi:hypothetical protein